MNAKPEDNLVRPQNCCPICSERRVDFLAMQDDGTVECLMCGTVYTPQASEQDPDLSA